MNTILRLDTIVAEDYVSVDERVAKAVNAIKRYGQFKPILINHTTENVYKLIAGRIVFEAMKELGATHVFCFVFDCLSVDEERVIKLIDNSPRSVNVVETATALQQLDVKNYKGLENVLNYTPDELQNFKDLHNFNWEDYDNDIKHYQTKLF